MGSRGVPGEDDVGDATSTSAAASSGVGEEPDVPDVQAAATRASMLTRVIERPMAPLRRTAS